MTSEKRMPSLPDVPTLQELGYGNFFQVAWWGVFAPKSTSAEAVGTLEKALLGIYSDADSKAYLDQNNFSAFTADAEGLREFQESEIKREVSLVKKFDIPQL